MLKPSRSALLCNDGGRARLSVGAIRGFSSQGIVTVPSGLAREPVVLGGDVFRITVAAQSDRLSTRRFSAQTALSPSPLRRQPDAASSRYARVEMLRPAWSSSAFARALALLRHGTVLLGRSTVSSASIECASCRSGAFGMSSICRYQPPYDLIRPDSNAHSDAFGEWSAIKDLALTVDCRSAL